MTSRIRLAPKHTDSGDEQPTERCRACEGAGEQAKVNYRLRIPLRICIHKTCPDCHGAGVVGYWSEGAGE